MRATIEVTTTRKYRVNGTNQEDLDKQTEELKKRAMELAGDSPMDGAEIKVEASIPWVEFNW